MLPKFSRDIKIVKGVARSIVIMADTVDVFKKFYSGLIKVVPMIINDVVIKLYSDKLLSGNHKDCIDSLATGKEKTEYLLDKVIKPGIEIDYTKLFDEMLRVMKSSDDPTVNYLVDEIYKFSTSYSMSTSSVDQTQATQGKSTSINCLNYAQEL